MFKVIVRDLGDGKVDALAFLIPQPYAEGSDHQPRPTENWVNCNKAQKLKHVYDHRPRLRSVAEIEEATRLTFFPGASNRDEVRGRKPTALWPVETNFWDTKVCAGQRYAP